jgi:hypothetical protein
VRDDQIRARLREVNPWWKAASSNSDPLAWIAADRALKSRTPYDLGYRPGTLEDVAHGPIDDKLVVLRGPRRVGKSVLLKDSAAALCERPDVSPFQVIYLPTDGMSSADIGRGLKIGRTLTQPIGQSPRVWLLDEITGIRGWTEEIKFSREHSDFGDDSVVCTGSSWDKEADVERDLFTGRAGRSSILRSRVLLPMRFRHVLSATCPQIPLPDPVLPWELQSEAVRVAASSLSFYTNDLDLAWQSYLESGGFPRAVAEYHRHAAVSSAFLSDLQAWLHQDVDPTAPADSVPRLISQIATRSVSPLNKSDAAQSLDYQRGAFELRIDRLVGSFACLWCPQVSDKGAIIPGTQKKLYLTDPLLAWLATHHLSGLPTPDHTHLSEAALAVAMATAVDALQPGRWMTGDAIGHVRTGSGREVDLGPVAVPSGGAAQLTTPVESKWVDNGWRGEAKVLEGRFGRGIMATKSITDFDHPSWAIPAPVVALLLG